MLVICQTVNLSGQTTTLRFGKLITGQGNIITDAVVVIEGARIASWNGLSRLV